MDSGIIFVIQIGIGFVYMNHKPIVAVLLSTYNGETYLREQIDSIFKQDNVEVKLFVRDDGSKDSTLEILNEYSQLYPIEIIVDGENVRPGESFMRLVYKYADLPDIDFYAFADQDDIWFPNKLFTAISSIRNNDMSIPVLYSSNQYIYTDGDNKGLRYNCPQRIDLISHMTRNTISGCTFVFNKALAQLLAHSDRPDRRIIRYRLHDAWIMLVAIVCGQVIYDENAYMLYRIHSNNTVGVREESFSERLKKLKRLFVKQDDANIRLITARELLRIFPDISEEDKRVISLFADYQNSCRDKFALAFNKDILNNIGESPLSFSTKVLFNFV